MVALRVVASVGVTVSLAACLPSLTRDSSGNPDAGTTGNMGNRLDGSSTDGSVEDATTGSEDGSTGDAADGSSGLAIQPGYLTNNAVTSYVYAANLGAPYDSILAAPKPTSTSAIAPTSSTQPAGQLSSTSTFQEIDSAQDLYGALDVPGSLSVSSGPFTGSVKMQYAQAKTIDGTKLRIFLDATRVSQSQQITNPTLTASAQALSPEVFYSLYGDRYATQITSGIELFGTIEIATSGEADARALASSLGLSYGATDLPSGFASTLVTQTAGRAIAVDPHPIGFTPAPAIGDAPTFLNAISTFSSSYGADAGLNATNQVLQVVYTSYYGLAGYPGVPVGTDTLVAQSARAVSDYLLYDSLVSIDFAAYYTDSSYSGLPFFQDMKAYRDGLSSFLSASIVSSQSPGVAVPTAASDGVIDNWATTSALTTAASADPQYTAYAIANGVLPKRISDYEIPIRYTHPNASGSGTLDGGITFSPVSAVPAVALSQKALDYPLYLVANKTAVGNGPWLEYRWDTGTYFFPSATNSSGAPDASLLGAAITTLSLGGNLQTQYIVVSKASGLVMTDSGATNTQLTATHLTMAGNSPGAGQQWEFYVDAGNMVKDCSMYVPPPAGNPPGINCSDSNNSVTNAQSPPCGSVLYGISALHTGYWQIDAPEVVQGGGAGCSYCNWNCTSFQCPYSGCTGGPVPTDTFFLQPYDSGNTQAIYDYQGNNGGAVSYVLTDPAATTSPENIVAAPTISGNGNELWVFIPLANVDTAP